MSKQLKLRRGTTAQHSTFTGAEGEVTVDTTKDTLVVHDGTTAGGIPLSTEASVSSLTTAVGTKAADSAVVHLTGDETVAGVKTFSSSPVLPGNATTALQAVPKQQLDSFAPAALSTATGSAPSYSCRAWVNFNGAGTVAIRASGNVSSITDNGAGDYTVNFTTAMPDANYSFGFGIDDDGFNDSASYHVKGMTWSASSLRIRTAFAWNAGSAFVDFGIVTLQIFR